MIFFNLKGSSLIYKFSPFYHWNASSLMPGIYVKITQWGWGSKNEPILAVGRRGADVVDSNMAVQHYLLQCFTFEIFVTTIFFKFGEITLL